MFWMLFSISSSEKMWYFYKVHFNNYWYGAVTSYDYD